MYLYSLVALLLTCILAPHIRKQSPMQNLAFAWFYLIDSIINAVYTAAFGVSWFVVLAQHNSPLGGDLAKGGEVVPGGKTIEETAGFTDPEHQVTQVEAIVDSNGLFGQHGTLIGHNAADSAPASGAFETTILERGSLTSIGVLCTMWLIRIYFILVVLAYARSCLRQYIALSSMNTYAPGGDSKMADDPFAPHKELGQGWRGKLGRAMISIGRGYWLGADERDAQDWERGFASRFGTGELRRPAERERRRRAGTGPSSARPVELNELQK